MPMPIVPVGGQFSKTDHEFNSSDNLLMMSLDAIAGAASSSGFGRTGGFQVNAEATDADASLLLDLFNRCQIVSESESLEDKKYAIPDDFSSDQVLRLKAASLINGDTKIIRFTSKAARVIKTLVLSEQNAYTKSAVKKPYSVILAENKMKAMNQSTLAFSKTASINTCSERNAAIDPEYMPSENSTHLASPPTVDDTQLVDGKPKTVDNKSTTKEENKSDVSEMSYEDYVSSLKDGIAGSEEFNEQF